MEITVLGAGAIGGVLGAYLYRAGHTVTFCDKVEEHVEQIRRHALRINGVEETLEIKTSAYTPDELLAKGVPLKTLLLCVKAQDTEVALRKVLPLVGPDTLVVSCQNGLCEPIIADIVGIDKTIGCFVNFSADYLEPGNILYAGPSAFYIGELDGQITPRLQNLHAALSDWGVVKMTDNIWGYLWGKLSYAALLFATALVDETMATVVRSERHRPALMELCAEVLEVADREGYHPLGFDDWEPSLVYPRESRNAEMLNCQLARLADRMATNKKTKSGIWRDLAVRKRKTEVDFQLVPVIEIGKRHQLAMPLTQFVVATIKDLENGIAVMDWSHLNKLAELN